MSNMKKTIPTLVGGVMLLTNTPAFAIEEIINEDNQNQELDNNLDIEQSEVSTDVSNDIPNIVVEVVEDIDLKLEKEELTEENESKIDDIEINDLSNTETELNSQMTQQEMVNLLSNVRSTSKQKVMIVNKESIIVREGSDSNSTQVGTLNKDDYVDVYEQNSEEGWSKINFEGKMSYVNTGDLIDVEKKYKESSEDNVSVRSGAGDTYSEFGKLSKGERVQVYQELENGWSKINYNSQIAFVETSKLVESYLSVTIVSSDKVKVYETASDSSNVLGESKKGETLLVYGYEGDYYKVKFGNAFGYVKKSDLALVENTEKPQTGDMMVFSYMGAVGVSVLGLVSVNRKKEKIK